MVVEQEMAEIYPPTVEELVEFLPETDCRECGFSSCIDFSEALIKKEVTPHKCPDLDSEFADKVASVLELNTAPIPYNVMMEQEPCTLTEINNPDKKSPLLITCNFQETVRIMREILERTSTPAYLLPTVTHGYSVDNAVHERMFKAMEIWKAMKENSVEEKVERPVLIIPGLAESEKNSIRQLTRWDVVVGPVSGFLVPLFILKNHSS
jgi:acetyl-CoA decarbonylase/synthase complex subunit gamma